MELTESQGYHGQLDIGIDKGRQERTGWLTDGLDKISRNRR